MSDLTTGRFSAALTGVEQPLPGDAPATPDPHYRADVPEPVYADDVVTLHNGDCLDVLRALPDDSVDAVVTDPPYGLGFMGKEWDSPGGTGDFPMRRFDAINTVNTGASRQGGRQRSCDDFTRRQARDARSYQEWCEQWARECLRVLKPGGHMLAFGGTRTAHRLASAIEDAGFELRDTIAWLYGSGFPKSRNLDGDWQGWGTALKPANEPIVVARKSPIGSIAANVEQYRTGAIHIDACRVEGNREAQDYTVTRWKPGATLNAEGGTWKRQDADAPTVTGTMPGDRWPPNVVLDPAAAADLDRQTGTLTSGLFKGNRTADKFRAAYGEFKGDPDKEVETYGDSGGGSRFFPVFSPYWRGETCCMCNGTGRDASEVTEPEPDGIIHRVIGYVENGRACRACNGHGRDPSDMPTFRYEPKAPQHERPGVDGVQHPTVKPLDLMRWLVRLVTPPGGVVLEPFAGSGTTAEACIVEGFRCIAIEREPDYIPLILARITKPIEPVLFGESA